MPQWVSMSQRVTPIEIVPMQAVPIQMMLIAGAVPIQVVVPIQLWVPILVWVLIRLWLPIRLWVPIGLWVPIELLVLTATGSIGLVPILFPSKGVMGAPAVDLVLASPGAFSQAARPSPHNPPT